MRTILIFFVMALGLTLVVGTDGQFESYFEDTFMSSSNSWYDLITSSFLSFSLTGGAVALGSILLTGGFNVTLIIAAAMLGAFIPIVLDAMNIVTAVALPIEATYFFTGTLVIMLLVMIVRFIRGT